MNILGISCFYHDSAATILQKGLISAAAQEERFSRIKGDRSFPRYSIAYCLDEAGLSINDLDYVAFYENPDKSFPRIISTLKIVPNNIFSTLNNLKLWGKERLNLERYFRHFYPNFKGNFFFANHHLSHAASAFFPTNFKEAAILTIDGVGEDCTASISKGENNKIEILKEMKFPHSLGLLYTTITTFLGFKANSGEYKVMGLAPYGNPSFYSNCFEGKLVKSFPDGSLLLNMEYFNFTSHGYMFTKKMSELFCVKPRLDERELLNISHMNIASSLQQFCEDTIKKMALYAKKICDSDNLCMAGGVALNCVSNGKIQKENIFKNIWIQPASGDSGNSLGAAYLLYHNKLKNPRIKIDQRNDLMQNSRLGPSFNDSEIRAFLDSINAKYTYIKSDINLAKILVDDLLVGKIFGLFRGRMEFGPRALGSRSIIGDPRSQNTQTKMNLKIKFRESFRPFAPFILRDHVHDWFEDASPDNKYMLFVNKLNKEKRLNEDNKPLFDGDMIRLLKNQRSKVPAVTHVDYTARLQTVSEEDNPFINLLLEKFYSETNIPFLVNTSFNVRGEPIVCTPIDAYNCFIYTYMDSLCIGNFYLRRSDQSLPKMSPDAIQALRGITD